ncbi:MAG TPA: hypothetical protein VNE39_25925 [Planctomycetota bacterium]|nr:hypothetical protein [Planctomycetota bacterium]
MNTGGWLMMIASWTVILALNAFCFYRLLTERPAGQVTHDDAPPPPCDA